MPQEVTTGILFGRKERLLRMLNWNKEVKQGALSFGALPPSLRPLPGLQGQTIHTTSGTAAITHCSGGLLNYFWVVRSVGEGGGLVFKR